MTICLKHVSDNARDDRRCERRPLRRFGRGPELLSIFAGVRDAVGRDVICRSRDEDRISRGAEFRPGHLQRREIIYGVDAANRDFIRRIRKNEIIGVLTRGPIVAGRNDNNCSQANCVKQRTPPILSSPLQRGL